MSSPPGFLLLALVILAQGPSSPDGFLPDGSAADLYRLGNLARLRDSRIRPIGFSSYDRTGGNDDGFRGTYSRLRVEDGRSLLAEVDGPGIIQRIWFTHTSADRPGLLDRKGEHLRVFLDGGTRPALDVPIEELFSGRRPGFPKPLVNEGSGGYVCYVPIPFRSGCKLVVDGGGVRFYQIGAIRLPHANGLVTLQESLSGRAREEIERAADAWSTPGTGQTPGPVKLQRITYRVDAGAHSTVEYALPAGPTTIRSVEFTPGPETNQDWARSRWRIAWDDDRTEGAGVDLPAEFLFGSIPDGIPFSSLLAGKNGASYYNRFPMPYRRQAILRIDAEVPFRGEVTMHVEPGTSPDSGYLRADFRRTSSPRKGEDFRWIKAVGRGHFAGIIMSTEGHGKLPTWLEGDDRFRVDGRLAIHGTGTEDYFNGGWYALKGRLDGPAAYPIHGFPLYRAVGAKWQVAAYRWHVPDPVPFGGELEAGIEHGPENATMASYRASIFWYSEYPSAVRPGPDQPRSR